MHLSSTLSSAACFERLLASAYASARNTGWLSHDIRPITHISTAPIALHLCTQMVAQLCFSFAACSFHDIYELASPWLYNFEVRLRASGVLVYLVTLACHDSNQALRVLLLTTPQLPNHGHGIH